jgi:hypothetical protein
MSGAPSSLSSCITHRVQYILCLCTVCLVHTAVLQWQSMTFRAHPTVVCISYLLQECKMAIRNCIFTNLSIWRLWKFGLIHLISSEITWWWYLAEVYCSEIWSGCLFPAKNLRTCNSVDPVWLPCTFRANCYYFPFTTTLLLRELYLVSHILMHVQIFNVQWNVPCVMSLIINYLRYENKN